MAEHRLFEAGTDPYVSTFAYHRDRERAPHLEQPPHQPRLHRAAEFVADAALRVTGDGVWGKASVSDLGCGDGGLLSRIRDLPHVGECWGYDWAPANAAGWAERGVTAYALDVFGSGRMRSEQGLGGHPMLGMIVVLTEVLEHLADPHGVLRWLSGRSSWLVASSPRIETPDHHDGSHAWAWDEAGYAGLLDGNGWEVMRHEPVGMFQLVLSRSRERLT